MILDNITHTNHKTLFTAQASSTSQFVTGGKLLALHGSNTAGTATLYDASAGTGVDLATTSGVFGTVNTQGTAAVVGLTDGNEEIIDLTTNDKIELASTISIPSFSGDGKTLFASTSSNGLVSVTWSGTAATVSSAILSSNVAGVWAVSGDGKDVLYYSAYDDTTFTSDLRLVTVAKPSSDRGLIASGATIFSFTPDSAYVTFGANIDQTTYTGPLDVAAVSGGAATQVSATAENWHSYGKDKLVVIDNVMANGKSSNADIEIVDLTMPAVAAKKLLSQVDYTSFIANDGATFYYVDTTTANGGLYQLTLP